MIRRLSLPVIVATVLTMESHAHGQLVLTPGATQSYNYQFNSRNFCYPVDSGASNFAGCILTLDTEGSEPGGSFRLEIFSATGLAASGVWSATNSSVALWAYGFYYPSAARITGLTGSVRITSVHLPFGFKQQSIIPPHPFEMCNYVPDAFVPTLRVFVRHVSLSEIQLMWTTNALGFRLESAERLPASQWDAVTNQLDIAGADYVVSVDPNLTGRYFRLRKP